jgi:hypothetical protein
MNLPENNRRVFIIRIWREPREIEGAQPEWRGVIESAYDDQRRYLKSLDEIITFILPYLDKMGVKVDMDGRLKQWLKRQQSTLPKQDAS